MKRKTNLELFLPPILLFWLKCLYRNIKYNKVFRRINISEIAKKGKRICLLGNGPSLNKSIEKYRNYIKQNDCLVCNFFANSDLYEDIKPNYYLIADPLFFSPLTSIKIHNTKIEDLLNNLIKKTQWEMNLIMPYKGYKSEFVSKIENENTFIHFFYYNTIDFKFYNTIKRRNKLLDKNLIGPPSQTVMNTAIYLAIFLAYEEIYLFGIDSTFFKALDIDQETNMVYTNNEHFNEKSRTPIYSDTNQLIPSKIHEIAGCFVKMFELYWELSEYATSKGVKVYNASEYSMVDAFERKKPME